MAKTRYTEKDTGYKELMTQFTSGKGKEALFVGFLRSSGQHTGSGSMTVAQIAAVHEFGSSDGSIPERSFMRSAVSANKSALNALLKKVITSVLEGKTSKRKALGVLGEQVVAWMRAQIVKGKFKPLKPATIARKGSSKPLIDTGQMLNSIDWEVRENK